MLMPIALGHWSAATEKSVLNAAGQILTAMGSTVVRGESLRSPCASQTVVSVRVASLIRTVVVQANAAETNVALNVLAWNAKLIQNVDAAAIVADHGATLVVLGTNVLLTATAQTQ